MHANTKYNNGTELLEGVVPKGSWVSGPRGRVGFDKAIQYSHSMNTGQI